MRKFLYRIMFVLFFVSTSLAEKGIVTDTSVRDIDLKVTFSGSTILVYGALDSTYEYDNIAIIVHGPARQFELRKLVKSNGVWLPELGSKFNAPSFYAILGSSDEVFADDSLVQNVYGLRDMSELTFLSPIEKREFIIIQKENRTYVEASSAINIKDGILFSAELNLPPNVVEGDYNVDYLLLKDNKMIARDFSVISVKRYGLEAFVEKLATEHAFWYGILTIFTAIAFSLGIGVVMRELHM